MHKELPELPARKKLPYLRRICTAATFADDGVVTVMLALCTIHRVAVATSRDHQWTISTWYYDICRAPFPYQGKMYVAYLLGVNASVKISQIDIPLPGEMLQPPKLIFKCTADKLHSPLFFVECCDSEVLVVAHINGPDSKLLVYKLADLVMEKFIPVPSIGDKAIFVKDRTLSASAKALPTLVGDTVTYFHPMEHRLVQYHFSSCSWSPAMDEISLYGSAPGPCSFIQHIHTCCSRKHWYVVVVSNYSIFFLLPPFGSEFCASSFDLVVLFICYIPILHMCLYALITGTKVCSLVGGNTLPIGFGGRGTGSSVKGLVPYL
jgi:hypothetical protein